MFRRREQERGYEVENMVEGKLVRSNCWGKRGTLVKISILLGLASFKFSTPPPTTMNLTFLFCLSITLTL